MTKIGMLLEQAEKVFFEAYRLQGWEFVLEEPLWLSWTLEHFGKPPFPILPSVCACHPPVSYGTVNTLSPILTLHNDHLVALTQLSKIIASSETSFEDARLALERWRDFAMRGERWNTVREWEELVNIELGGGREEEEEEDDEPISRKGKKKGKK